MDNMENNEKLLEALKKIDFDALVNSEPIFPKNVYEMFEKSGLSEEEISSLEDSEILARAVEVLPDDAKSEARLNAAIGAISKDSSEENARNFLLIAQKDPKVFLQLMSLVEVFDAIEVSDDNNSENNAEEN